MDTLEFRVVPPDPELEAWIEDCPGVQAVVEIRVNGREIVPVLREIETAYDPRIAGAYGHLTPGELYPELAGALASGDAAALLCCDGCGFIGCWSVYVHVHEDGEAVCWDGFEHNHRDWAYPLAFRFEKQAYAEAMEVLKGCIF